MELIEVRGAPSYYACKEGVLETLELLLLNSNIKNVLVIFGKNSWKAVEPFFPNFHSVKLTFAPYNGECSLSEVNRIADIVKSGEFEAVLGIGGGKVLDLTKAVGHETNKEVILIPTLAATCAAWTPLSVFYNEKGEFTHYSIFPKSTWAVLVEPSIILHSPIEYFRAGIADTLAKWYEADALIRHLVDPPLAVKIAHQTAKLCQEVLLKKSAQALIDQQGKILTSNFLQVLESIIVAGGMVGGFGDKYGRIAAAHSVHNGLTTVKETHHLLHGEKVAYGILSQLALEENWVEVEKLVPFYKVLELPYQLNHLGLSLKDMDKLHAISERTIAPGESIHFLEGTWTAEKVYKSFVTLEEYIAQL